MPKKQTRGVFSSKKSGFLSSNQYASPPQPHHTHSCSLITYLCSMSWKVNFSQLYFSAWSTVSNTPKRGNELERGQNYFWPLGVSEWVMYGKLLERIRVVSAWVFRFQRESEIFCFVSQLNIFHFHTTLQTSDFPSFSPVTLKGNPSSFTSTHWWVDWIPLRGELSHSGVWIHFTLSLGLWW